MRGVKHPPPFPHPLVFFSLSLQEEEEEKEKRREGKGENTRRPRAKKELTRKNSSLGKHTSFSPSVLLSFSLSRHYLSELLRNKKGRAGKNARAQKETKQNRQILMMVMVSWNRVGEEGKNPSSSPRPAPTRGSAPRAPRPPRRRASPPWRPPRQSSPRAPPSAS